MDLAQVFREAFQTAELASMTKEQRDDYEKNRLSYIGIKQVTEPAEKEGLKKGREERSFEIAKSMKMDGLANHIISKHTGLA